jgi:hypothetical protein
MIGTTPAIVSAAGSEPEVCRCGTRVVPGSRRLRVQGLPESVEALFEGRRFCSGRCVRAYFLESMEILDSIYTQGATMAVSDLHQVYQTLAQSFADLLRDPSLPP